MKNLFALLLLAVSAAAFGRTYQNIDAPNVVGAEEVYYDPEKAGHKCVILGGGLVGLELGVFLAGYRGREVDVIEMMPTTLASDKSGGTSERMDNVGMVAGEALVQGVALSVKLKELPNMAVHTSTRAVEVTETGLRVAGPEGGAWRWHGAFALCAAALTAAFLRAGRGKRRR